MSRKCSCGDRLGQTSDTHPASGKEEGGESVLSGIDGAETNMDFRPVRNVRRRKTSGTYRVPLRIGMVLPYPSSFFLQERLRGALTASEEAACELVLYCVRNADEYECRLGLIAAEKRLDGLIVLSLLFPETEVMKFLSLGMPVCMVNSEIKGFGSIYADIREIGRTVASSLYEKGYRRPAFFGEPTSFTSMVPIEEELYRGFKNSWVDNGICLAGDFVWFGSYVPMEIERVVSQFVSYENMPDCIFIPCDCMALMLIRELEKKNLRVPDQIAVMSAGNSLISRCFSISSVDLRLAESGYLAVRSVLECLMHKRRPSCHVLPFEIIDRASVAQRGGDV